MNDSVFHIDVFFSGHVQGVGFRYQTHSVAKEFDVSGYVQNLPDGRVRLEAEGEESEVVAFKAEVERQLASFIRSTEASSSVRPRAFSGFSIKK